MYACVIATIVIDEPIMFESATPSIVKSIRQRDLLNAWLRLYAAREQVPPIADYQPERVSDEMAELGFFAVDHSVQPPALTFERESARMANAYGRTSDGRKLEEYLGPRMAPFVMPAYHTCIAQALPVYTILMVADVNQRKVAYERLLLPFSDGAQVKHVIASHKSISEDGNFEIRNLLRSDDSQPELVLRAVIDQNLFHRAARRADALDVVEFD
jgi:hypothetical protein